MTHRSDPWGVYAESGIERLVDLQMRALEEIPRMDAVDPLTSRMLRDCVADIQVALLAHPERRDAVLLEDIEWSNVRLAARLLTDYFARKDAHAESPCPP